MENLEQTLQSFIIKRIVDDSRGNVAPKRIEVNILFNKILDITYLASNSWDDTPDNTPLGFGFQINIEDIHQKLLDELRETNAPWVELKEKSFEDLCFYLLNKGWSGIFTVIYTNYIQPVINDSYFKNYFPKFVI